MAKKTNMRFFHCKNLGQPGSLENILESMLNLDFRLRFIRVGNHVDELHASWDTYGSEVLKNIDIAYEKRHLAFYAADNYRDEDGNYFTGWLDFSWTQTNDGNFINQILYAYSKETHLFIGKKIRNRYSQRFLDLGIKMYNLLCPTFGWIDHCPVRGFTKAEDIDSLHIPHIYWANFFGPAFVKKHGREFLLGAPGLKKEHLSDDGFLYVLKSYIGHLNTNKSLNYEVRQYFKGVSETISVRSSI